MADTGLATPSLATLIDRISSDLNNRLPGNDSRIRRSVLYVLTRVVAGVAFLLYGFALSIANQILVDSANLTFLARHGRIWGVTQKLATSAVGNVILTGTNGTTIPAGTLAIRGDGVQYATDADAVIASGTATIPSTAVVAGVAGNTAAATVVNLVSPIAGINSAGTTGAMSLGTDDETADAWRARIIDRIRAETQGGSLSDYRIWTEATPSVNVAAVFPLAHTPNAGDVSVFFLVAGSGAARIPSGGQVALVQTQLNGKRPINDTAIAAAPSDSPVSITVHGLLPNTTAQKDAVTASVVALFDANATLGGTIANGLLQSAIGDTPGILAFVVTDINGDSTGHSDIVAPSFGVSRLSTPIVWT